MRYFIQHERECARVRKKIGIAGPAAPAPGRGGPYSQVIVANEVAVPPVWTAYEHVQGISVSLGDEVTPDRPIGRYMTRREIKRWGWHFNHVHFEVLKVRPRPFPGTRRLPDYLYYTYNLQCHTQQELERAYFNPETFLKEKWLRR